MYDKDNKEITVSNTNYYDHGTEFYVSVRSVDAIHYQVVSTISIGTSEDVIRQGSETKVAAKLATTNLGNMSGFKTVMYQLTDRCKIETSVVAEKYTIKLNEQLSTGEEVREVSTQTEWFSISDNIYYRMIGDFSYNREVEIQIFTANPKVDGSQYQVLESVQVNGRTLTLNKEDGEVNGQQGTVYMFKYKIQGELLANETQATTKVEAVFKPLYFVDLG